MLLPRWCTPALLAVVVLGFFVQHIDGWSYISNVDRHQARVVPSTQSGVLASNRRAFLDSFATTSTVVVTVGAFPQASWSRTPGSQDLNEAIEQIRDALVDLKKLQQNWDQYAVIDKEGRSVGDATILARRILGGVAPQAGDSAIAVAKATPLYRVDGALGAVKKAAIEETQPWISNLDLLTFEELSERIQFALQKADGDFYSVTFASKGTKQIDGIFKEAKAQVDQGIVDFEAVLGLLKEAGAPGL